MAQAVDPAIETFASIKVVGVGGAGGAAINRMVDAGVTGVDFVAVNADAQALHHSRANQKVHIGKDTTKGLGAGADPVLLPIGNASFNAQQEAATATLEYQFVKVQGLGV